jgi:hypothetical protein
MTMGATPPVDMANIHIDKGEFVNMIRAVVKDSRAVRRTVSIPKWMMELGGWALPYNQRRVIATKGKGGRRSFARSPQCNARMKCVNCPNPAVRRRIFQSA